MTPLALFVVAVGLLFVSKPERLAHLRNAGAADPTPSPGQRWFFRYVFGGILVVVGGVWFLSG